MSPTISLCFLAPNLHIVWLDTMNWLIQNKVLILFSISFLYCRDWNVKNIISHFLFLTCIYCNFISIAQMKLVCRKFKWNRTVKIAENENSTFIGVSSSVLIDTWCLQTLRSWWLFWRDFSTSIKILYIQLVCSWLVSHLHSV